MDEVDEEDLLFVYCQSTRNYFRSVSRVTQSCALFSKQIINHHRSAKNAEGGGKVGNRAHVGDLVLFLNTFCDNGRSIDGFG